MRYEDWDVLLFPSGHESKVPMKEFKVSCHVVPDSEFSHCHGAHGMPIMTCFMPSLQTGAPFHISIHCWKTPEVSRSTRTYSKHPELVKFEARILVDGRAAASTAFDRAGQWPHLINGTFEATKAGEVEPLRFPPFRRELLHQNHWNPGDDTGRIKILISEGFPRDSLTTPIERVKNIVAFSFQHAPMDILESNGIAWPNPLMWRGPVVGHSMPMSTYHPDEGSESHGHSPRRRSIRMVGGASQSVQVPLMPAMATLQPSVMMSSAFGQSLPLGQRLGNNSGSTCPDPFSEPVAYRDWLNSVGMGSLPMPPASNALWPTVGRMAGKHHSNTDTSMPDFTSTHSAHHMAPDPMHISGPSLDDDYGIDVLKAPTNTPTIATPGQASDSVFHLSNSVIPGELATSLTHSLLNQPHPLPVFPHQIPLPASEVRSRKENRQPHMPVGVASPSSEPPTTNLLENRKFSQSAFNMLGPVGTGRTRSASRVSSNSPSSGPAFSAGVSRNMSSGDFGVNVTNMSEPSQPNSNASVGVGPDKGIKRIRNFTVASTNAVDDEEEDDEDVGPLRPSPHLRLSPYGGENGVDNCP